MRLFLKMQKEGRKPEVYRCMYHNRISAEEARSLRWKEWCRISMPSLQKTVRESYLAYSLFWLVEFYSFPYSGRLRALLLISDEIAFKVRSCVILHRSDNSLIRSPDMSKLFVPRISPNIASSSGVNVLAIDRRLISMRMRLHLRCSSSASKGETSSLFCFGSEESGIDSSPESGLFKHCLLLKKYNQMPCFGALPVFNFAYLTTILFFNGSKSGIMRSYWCC